VRGLGIGIQCWQSITIATIKPSSPFHPHPHQQFNASSARSRLNLVYMLLSFYCLMPYISMGLYAADKKFYLSDASSQLYRPFAYYMAKVSCGAGRVPLQGPALPFFVAAASIRNRQLELTTTTTCPFTQQPPPSTPNHPTRTTPPLLHPNTPDLRHHALPNRLRVRLWLHRVRDGRPAARLRGDPHINTLMYLIASQVLHCCAVIAPNQDVAFMLVSNGAGRSWMG